VPDKGGVYFGEALAGLNAGRPSSWVCGRLAAECLNDPSFLTSPWWTAASLAPLRAATLVIADSRLRALRASVPASRWPYAEIGYADALVRWMAGSGSAPEVAEAAHDAARRQFFEAKPVPPDLMGAVRAYHRTRTGYPVLMRQPEIGVLTDVYLVQDSKVWAGDRAYLFPAKGWLDGWMELSAPPDVLKP